MHAMGVNQIMGVHVILFLIQKLFPINILTKCIIENNSLSAEISLLTSAKIIGIFERIPKLPNYRKKHIQLYSFVYM